MNRRRFLALLAASGLAAPFEATRAAQTGARTRRGAREIDLSGVDPYFLESGDLQPAEQASIEEFVGYQERALRGEDAVLPRGGRPKRAPTYRFLRWEGELGSADGRLVGPLSVPPALPPYAAYQMNAQILGFRAASADWKSSERGTLTIELRARLAGEPMTWLFAQQFDVYEGIATLGLEYVGQREGRPDPVITDEPGVDIRIQLMRERKRARLLGTILKIWSLVAGFASGGLLGPVAATGEVLPAMRVPRLLREGVAFSQALFGSTADEIPVWRSAFNAYSLAQGGSRLGLAPGFWVAIDETAEVDLRGVRLDDLGGRAALTRDGAPLDANHLVLALEMSEARLPSYFESYRDVIPKGVPPPEEP